MERIRRFDIGDKRIGVAISDPFNTYALPSETYFGRALKRTSKRLQNREKQGRNEDNLRTARQLRRESGSANGEDGKIYRSAEEATATEVICEDERFTTKMAHETLISEGMRREKRKNYVDALAAANILDGYLAKLSGKKGV